MLRHLYGWSQIVLYGALMICLILAVFTRADGFAVHQAIDAASFAVFEILLALKLAMLRASHMLKITSLFFTATVGLGIILDSLCTSYSSICAPGIAVFVPDFTFFAMGPAIALGWVGALDLLGAIKPWSRVSLYIFGALFCIFLGRSAFSASESTSVAMMLAVWVLLSLVISNLVASQIDYERMA